LALTVALMALEFLVAFLQAYVFAILTCIYINDAINPGTEVVIGRPSRNGVSIWIPLQRNSSAAGIACIGMGGAGVGLSASFSASISLRRYAILQPAQGQFGNLIFGLR